MQGEIQFAPVPHDAAAKIIAGRPVVTQAVFRKMLPEIRARSFLISGIEDLKVAQELRDIIAELPQGQSWESIKKQVAERLLGPGGIPWMDDDGASKRAELLMRHHGFQAYAAASYREMDEQRNVFPYWKYLSMGDEKVRSSHAKLHGLILPADHPFWKDHYPPWEWGCRCQVIPITEAEYNETVDAGRVAGKMDLTGKVDEDFPTKTQGWTLPPAGMNQLETTGRLDEGIGSTVNVASPRQLAQNQAEARDAYQWNPGDLRMPVSELHERYGKDPVQLAAFNAFFDNMQSATFLGEDGRPRRVWDWALSADIERHAKEIRAKPGSTKKELLTVIDYKTGNRIAEDAGGEDRVRFVEHAKKAYLNGQQTAMVHNHVSPGGPSPADVAALFRFNPVLKTVSVVDSNGVVYIVSAETSLSTASKFRMARMLDRMMEKADAGILSDKQWEDCVSRMIKSGRLYYESK